MSRPEEEARFFEWERRVYGVVVAANVWLTSLTFETARRVSKLLLELRCRSHELLVVIPSYFLSSCAF